MAAHDGAWRKFLQSKEKRAREGGFERSDKEVTRLRGGGGAVCFEEKGALLINRLWSGAWGT